MTNEDDGFLKRWAQRKVEADKETKPPQEVETPSVVPGRMITEPILPKDVDHEDIAVKDGAGEPNADEPERVPDQENDVEDFENFDFDSLTYDSDYSRFMKSGVPDAVRRKALRMLWHSNPILANVDGLNDYDEDFTDAAVVIEGMKSAYQVGRGYLTDEDIKREIEGESTDDVAANDEQSADDTDAVAQSNTEHNDADEAATDDGESDTDDDVPSSEQAVAANDKGDRRDG